MTLLTLPALFAIVGALLSAAPAHPASPSVSSVAAQSQVAPATGFDWPLSPRPPVLRRFDPPVVRWGSGHRGVDLGGSTGQPVRAAGDGVISHSGVIAGRGTVTVTHSDGRRTTYEPLDDRISTGTQVHRGDRIGSLADGHCPQRACLHWGLLIGPDDYRDPLSLLQPKRIVLLPLNGG